MRVLGGRGIAALIRDVDVSVDADETNGTDETVSDTETESVNGNETNTPNSHLTPPELRARIREQLAPVFLDDTATIWRKIESVVNPLRNDLTQSSFAQLRHGKLHRNDTKRMSAFRTYRTRDREP